jgi:UDP-3-O-[3-hydroxymyristoyl] N-acetylglucosamine deacetylase
MVLIRAAYALRQQTLNTAIACRGVGLHSGRPATLTLRPAAANSGIRFRRVDRAADGFEVAADIDNVVDHRLATAIGAVSGPRIGTVEHLLAALSGCGIDNALLDLDGPEVPIMDGSAAPFVFLIESAGIVAQDAPRRAIEVLRPVSVVEGEKRAELSPGSGYALSFQIDFPSKAIGRQDASVRLVNGTFKREIAPARTFGFEHEVAALRVAGLAAGGDLSNAIVVRGHDVVNDEGLRFSDEFVRHKVLDSIGDLYLAGAPIVGQFHGVRSGHALNHALLRALRASPQSWRWADAMADAEPAHRARSYG